MERKNLKRLVSAGAVLAALLLLGGCSIHEQRDAKSGDKKVDIATPFGSIKVNTAAKAEDTGWPVYPGARIKQSDDADHHKSANVNISGPMFGLKVAVVEYESDDSPDKVLNFYREKMKTFGGAQLECKNTGWEFGHRRSGDNEGLKCDDRSHGDTVELKAGTKDHQHVVAVKPRGSGSDFALVFVQAHGKEGAL